MKDLMNHIHLIALAAVLTAGDNTPVVGTVVDRRVSVGFESVTFAIITGSLPDADATFTVLVEHSDASGSGFTAVPDEMLIGTEVLASFVFSDDNKVFKIGYVGDKRYIRITLTPAGNTGTSIITLLAILGHAHATPTANPPSAA